MNINAFPLWTAIITPMHSNGEIDYASLERLVRSQEDAGVAILVLGSTGEALNLDEHERKKIIEFVCGLNVKVPLMAGIGGINLNETMEWLKYLESMPLHAYLMVTPLYARPGVEGQFHWFKTLMDKATKPCMLYNIPGRTGISLQWKALEKLKGHPRLWAIKEASGKTQDFQRYSDIDPNLLVYSGDDALLPQYVPLKARGLVSVAGNVWPAPTLAYSKKALAQKLDQEEQTLWRECAETLFIASNPVPVKRLMAELKLIGDDNVRPPLSSADLESAGVLIEAHARIQKWFKDQQ